MKIVKPAFLIILLLFSFIFLFYHFSVYAAEIITPTPERFLNTWFDDTQKSWEQKTFIDNPDNITGETHHLWGTSSLIHELYNKIAGAETPSLRAAGQAGAIGSMGNLIASMVKNPPARTQEYLADIGSNLGLPVKSVYAQGIGWQALTPVLPIWKAFRNLSYMAFVVIFVVIGFMIMFRAKINPQTVISIQAALPRIVLTLLLITFSYAIAGLMIDLIYIFLYLLVGAFSLSGVIQSQGINPIVQYFTQHNPFHLVYNIKEGAADPDMFLNGPADAIQSIVSGLFGNWFPEEHLGHEFIGALAKLVLAVAVFFQLFKLFFSLLISYIAIVLGVIFAPLNLLFNALPGSNAFIGWLKTLFANVIVFPAVAAMFLIAAILIGPKNNAAPGSTDNPWYISQGIGFYSQAQPDRPVWIPPMLGLGTEDDPGGAGDANAFQGLIALGMIMITPQIVVMIKKLLKVEAGGLGATIAGGIMAGPATIGSLGTSGYNLGSQLFNIRSQKRQTTAFTQMAAAAQNQRLAEDRSQPPKPG